MGQENARETSFPFLFLVKVLVAQLCPTVCNSRDCSPPGSSVYGILQARILEWVAISFSRASSKSRDCTWVSHIVGRFFYHLRHLGEPIKSPMQVQFWKSAA